MTIDVDRAKARLAHLFSYYFTDNAQASHGHVANILVHDVEFLRSIGAKERLAEMRDALRRSDPE